MNKLFVFFVIASFLYAEVLSFSLSVPRVFNQLVLVRHGESVWNQENKFTGWHDVPLSAKGEAEAKQAGILMKEEKLSFDKAYTSYLQRAIKTLYLGLEHSNQMTVPITPVWQLNERHYGALQGLNKEETLKKYGKDLVLKWRRSYSEPPPEIDQTSDMHPKNMDRYKNIKEAAKIGSESLKTTLERVVPFFTANIAPEIEQGKRLIITAHGNSLRALVKHLDGLSDSAITEVNIPTATPLLYQFDKNMKVIPHDDGFSGLRGRYLGNQEEIKNKILGVKNQTK